MSTPEPEKILVERLRYMMTQQVNRIFWEDVHVAVEQDWLTGDLLVRFEKELLGEKLSESEHDVSFPFPATWWQHWKSSHAPAWLVRRWPVRFAAHVVRMHLDVLAAFPETSIKTPPHLRGEVVLPVYRIMREEEVDE